MDIVYITLLLLLQESSPTFAATVPYYNWPLAPEYSSTETKGRPSVASGGCLSADIGHPSLDYNSVKLNGNTQSYKEFTLDDMSIIFQDFTISMFVSPMGESGTFFHYEKQDMTTGIESIKGIILSYNVNVTTLFVIGENNTDVIVNISMQYYYQDGEWTRVTAEYDLSGRVFQLWVGPEAVKAALDVKKYLVQPGKLRMGGSFYPEYNPFSGRATCLQFYDDKLGNNIDDPLLNCMSTNWQPVAVANTESPYPACDTMRGYYAVSSRGMTPSTSTTPLASLTTSSRVKCADWCALPSNTCVSFTINRSTKVCKLYDVYESMNLVSETGTDYFVSRTLLNCC